MSEEYKSTELVFTDIFNEPSIPDKKLILSGQSQDLRLIYDINTSEKIFKIYF